MTFKYVNREVSGVEVFRDFLTAVLLISAIILTIASVSATNKGDFLTATFGFLIALITCWTFVIILKIEVKR